MTEKLLQYIWQFGYFNRQHLQAASGEELQIVFPGRLNTNQGPDFLEARIRIGDTLLAGSIELHLRSSDWLKHQHENDPNYKNVILHVVAENDVELKHPFPVLEIGHRISQLLLTRYQQLMETNSFIACERNIAKVKDITWLAWKERLLAERLSRKAHKINEWLLQNHHHWEETFWWMLARNFGTKVNADAFENLARSLPLTTLTRHKTQLLQLESMLLGQAGLLNDVAADEYVQALQKEYQFLKQKYQLAATQFPVHTLRMRPGNFPAIRLAQLASLLQQSTHLFSKIIEAENIEEVKKWFAIKPQGYWNTHYTLGEASAFRIKKLGGEMISNIIINTVVPMLFAYGLQHKNEKLKAKALQWLEKIGAERNQITKGFEAIAITNLTAYDSQALIELKNEYCNNKHCLRCAVGNALLKE